MIAPHTDWRRETIVAGGAAIALYSTGSDDPGAPLVVLVHGLGHWATGAWDPIAPALDPSWRIVAFDLPGFGESARSGAYDLAFFRRTLVALLDALDAPHAALVGHSLGALICADVAATHPLRVRRLALLAPAGFALPPRYVVRCLAGRFAAWMFARPPSRRYVARIMRRAFHDPSRLDAETIDRGCAYARDPGVRAAFAAVYAGAMQSILHPRRLRRHLARYRGPVFIGWGENDAYIPPHDALPTAHAVYPHAVVERYPATGHLLTVERAADVGASLRAFLQPESA